MRAFVLLLIALPVAAFAFECPPDQKISVELPAWKKSLLAAAPGSDEQHALLAALRFRVVPDAADLPEEDCAVKPVVEGVDVFEANLTGSKDKLVQARFRTCKGQAGAEWISQRFAVLVPLGKGELCKLDGEDLSVDQRADDSPCMGQKPAKLARTVSLLELTEKGRKVVQAKDQHGACGKDAPPSGSTKVAFFEAQGWSLKKIFETPAWELSAVGEGHLLEKKWKLSILGKIVPKDLRVEECVEGASCAEPDDYEYSAPGGKYVHK